jgi:hypothetical protein
MKKLMLIAAAIILSVTAANADQFTFQCAGARFAPAERPERDPVVQTVVEVELGSRPSFSIVHTTLNGNEYDRYNQYRNTRVWMNRQGVFWSGVNMRSPNVTMIGQITSDRSPFYIEKIYSNGRLEKTITSTCVVTSGAGASLSQPIYGTAVRTAAASDQSGKPGGIGSDYVVSPPLPTQELGSIEPRTPGAGGEAAPLGGAPDPRLQMQAQPPVFQPYGPFMTAVDPDGTIVNAQQPLVLTPKEYSAEAKGDLPHDCPRPTAQEDADYCN